MMRTIGWFLCALALLAASPAWATPIADLQHLLNNAGYNAGPTDGVWGRNTASALAGFAAQYGIDAGDTGEKPDEAAIAEITDAAKAALDAAYVAYPTQPLPQDYSIGLGSKWFFIDRLGPTAAIVNRDGHRTRLPIANYFAPADGDIEAFHAVGVKVIRMQLGMEGALFHDECKHVPTNSDSSAFDECYARAYAEAKATDWAPQIEALSHFSDNEVVDRYVDGVEYWNNGGFHVIVVPTDFYTGRGSHFDGTDAPGTDTLFHTALMQDRAFQAFFPRFVGAVVNELKQRGLTNVSVQPANEPRFCKNSRPTASGLRNWTSIERAVIDHVRRVAPRISIVSSAVCLSGVTYFGSGQPYSQLARIMPIHPGIDDIAYSIHLYNPGALMMGTAQNALYKPGTIIHYPFQRIPESAGLNDEARYSIRMYNRTNPDAEYFDKVFRDIATFSETHDIRIMVTETGAPNPTFGLPREDRIALFRDLITHSKQYDVPLNYHFVGSEWGLSSCHHIVGVADHRFDPALMNLIAFGNSVPGAKPDAPIEPLEVQCGPPVKYLTDEIVDESNSPANWIHGIFRLVVAGAEGSSKFNDFGVQGTYSDFNHNISGLSFTIIQPALDGDVPAALRACSGVSFPSWDGRNHLNFQVHANGATLQVQGINCILENTEGEVAAMARLLGLDFKKVVADMVTTGSANAITNDDLRQWINDIADGSIIFESAED